MQCVARTAAPALGLFFLPGVTVAGQDAHRAQLGQTDETSGPGADIDAEVLERLTRAIERDAADTVLRLLGGVDAEQFSPLHEAAGHGSARVTKALLDAGVDANAGATRPLHVAARYESPEVAALLIERGAEVNARDAIGWTPLHYALLRQVERPAFRTANLLLEHGAEVTPLRRRWAGRRCTWRRTSAARTLARFR